MFSQLILKCNLASFYYLYMDSVKYQNDLSKTVGAYGINILMVEQGNSKMLLRRV